MRKGLLRSYKLDEKGKEHVFMFAPENWFVGDIEAHAFEKSSDLFVDALEDSEIEVYEFLPEYRLKLNEEKVRHNLELLMRRLGVLQKRVLMLIGTPAIERYEDLIQTYPDITQKFHNG